MTNLLIVDDHPLIADGLKALLAGEPDLCVVGEAVHGEQALEMVRNRPVNVVILDINMPVMDGFDTCRVLQEKYPEIRVLALSAHDSPSVVQRMVRLGARGVVQKNTSKAQLLQAIRSVGRGDRYYQVTPSIPITKAEQPRLTRREQEVLRMIVGEQTTREIAVRLSVSVNTVETHRRHLMQKLKARNTAGLVRIAIDRQLVDRRYP